MWRTPNGERTMQGAEAALFREAIAEVLERIEDEEDFPDDRCSWGVRVFDGIASGQQLALLAIVARALFDSHVPPPKLNAVNESVIGVMFIAIEQAIQFEIDEADSLTKIGGNPFHWRKLVLAAIIETDGSPAPGADDELPDPTCPDIDEWSILLETLGDGVLWDGDWEMDDLFMDVDPKTSKLRKEFLTIDDDYYTAVAPDPTPEQLAEARRLLRTIVHDSSC